MMLNTLKSRVVYAVLAVNWDRIKNLLLLIFLLSAVNAFIDNPQPQPGISKATFSEPCHFPEAQQILVLCVKYFLLVHLFSHPRSTEEIAVIN